VGGFSANYLGREVGDMLGMSYGASAFIVGLAGMAICQGIVESSGAWRSNMSGRFKND